MHAHGRLSLARLLAPLALIAFAVVLVAVVLGSGVVGDDGGDGATTTGANSAPASTQTNTTERRRNKSPRTYTIKPNDTLSGIAERTGTTVEQLQELNPELDPQGLVAGQKIKLRE